METGDSKVTRLAYAIVLVLASAWVAGVFIAPLVDATSTLAGFLHLAYSKVCHQITDRSFHIAGQPLAVCSRCSGVYAGYLAGLFIYPLVRSLFRTDTPPRIWLLVALVPVAVDFLGGYAGIFENTSVSRALTGSIAGVAGAFYTLPGLVSMAASAWTRRKHFGTNKQGGTKWSKNPANCSPR